MNIENNRDLVKAVNEAIKESGIKKSFIAEKLGISKQAFTHFMDKTNFSIDDANKILSVINKKVIAEIVDKINQ